MYINIESKKKNTSAYIVYGYSYTYLTYTESNDFKYIKM